MREGVLVAPLPRRIKNRCVGDVVASARPLATRGNTPAASANCTPHEHRGSIELVDLTERPMHSLEPKRLDRRAATARSCTPRLHIAAQTWRRPTPPPARPTRGCRWSTGAEV